MPELSPEQLHFLRLNAWMIPNIFIGALGVITGLMKMQRFPLIAPAVLVTSILHLLHVFAWPFVFEATQKIEDDQERANALMMIGIGDGTISAVMLGILFWAVFAGRTAAPLED